MPIVNGNDVILGPCPLLLFDSLLLPEATAGASYNMADKRQDLGLLVTLGVEVGGRDRGGRGRRGRE